jgi:hypothetical protein
MNFSAAMGDQMTLKAVMAGTSPAMTMLTL